MNEAYSEIEREVEEMRQALLRGEPAPRPQPQRKQRKKAAPSPRRPTHNHQEILRLYEEGLSVLQVAQKTGSSRMTVYRVLENAKVALRDSLRGPKMGETCRKGHSRKKYEKKLKDGGRYCTECSRIRARAAYERKKQGVGS